MIRRLARALPDGIQRPIRALRDRVSDVQRALTTPLYTYGRGRFCPVCEQHSRRFRPFGYAVLRPDAECVHCGALERHRFVWHYLRREQLLERVAGTFLHVAPEASLEPHFRRVLGSRYLTADLFDPRAMVKMDVTAIEFPSASFGAIYCAHVLEHVPDDAKAMREFRRVLAPGGWAIFTVPVNRRVTYEDPTITDPADRAVAFGQSDHVRDYGPDIADRLHAAGFDVTVVDVHDVASPEDVRRMALASVGCNQLFFCRLRQRD